MIEPLYWPLARARRVSIEDAMTDFHHVSQRKDLDRACDVAARLGVPQLPLLQAAASGLLALITVPATHTPWPTKQIERTGHRRPVVVLVGGDPNEELHPDHGQPDPAPSEWVCARRIKYFARGVIVHGAAGEHDHYRAAIAEAVLVRRLAFIETTSLRAPEWAAFLGCRLTHLIVPVDGVHPVPDARPLQ